MAGQISSYVLDVLVYKHYVRSTEDVLIRQGSKSVQNMALIIPQSGITQKMMGAVWFLHHLREGFFPSPHSNVTQ